MLENAARYFAHYDARRDILGLLLSALRIPGWRIVTLLLAIVIPCAAPAQHNFKSQLAPGPWSDSTQSDHWVVFAEPYSSADQFRRLAITAGESATVIVEQGSKSTSYDISPGKVTYISIKDLPALLSGRATADAAVRVYCTSRDIEVYAIGGHAHTGEGYRVPALNEWGRSYVVASYSALFLQLAYDYPSEFYVVSAYDDTRVRLTPSADVRDGNSTIRLIARGVEQSVTLGKGETVVYRNLVTQGSVEWDLTGSRVSSSFPIGVIGGVQRAEIPMAYPVGGHIIEATPPVRSWGKHYYSAPLYDNRTGDAFLIVFSQPNQSVTRRSTSNSLELNGESKYSRTFVYDVSEPTHWYSDAPFLLMQYNTSVRKGADTSELRGDLKPAMLAVPPVESYSKNCSIVLPDLFSSGDRSQFVYVICPNDAIPSLTIDGKKAWSNPKVYGDSAYSIFSISTALPGVHLIASDSALGVVGFGVFGERGYAWRAGKFVLLADTLTDADPPVWSERKQECDCITGQFVDTGVRRSGLKEISYKSASNFMFEWFGVADPGAYRVCVIDSRLPASISITASDSADNIVTVLHSYAPPTVAIDQRTQILGHVATSSTLSVVVMIKNMTADTVFLTAPRLRRGDRGFKLIGATPIIIPPNAVHEEKVSFSANAEGVYTDTVSIAEECSNYAIPIIAYAGEGALSVSGAHFGDVAVSTTKLDLKQAVVTNLSQTLPVTITQITFTDPAFAIVSPMLPFALPPGAPLDLSLTFTPALPQSYQAEMCLHTELGVVKCATLDGVGIEGQLLVDPSGESSLAVFPNPASERLRLRFTAPRIGKASIVVKDILGREVMNQEREVSDAEFEIDVRALPIGRYQIAIQMGDAEQTSTFSIVR